MFSDTGGEKAAKLCSETFLSSRLDAHHTNIKDLYISGTLYQRI